MEQTNLNPQTIGLVDAVKIALTKKYVDFSGRATVAEYWWFFLFNVVAGVVLGFIPYVGWVISIALLIPSLAISWRRMHDIGKGGGWYFINLIPVIGWIIWIILAVQSSQPQPNRFGPVPGK